MCERSGSLGPGAVPLTGGCDTATHAVAGRRPECWLRPRRRRQIADSDRITPASAVRPHLAAVSQQPHPLGQRPDTQLAPAGPWDPTVGKAGIEKKWMDGWMDGWMDANVRSGSSAPVPKLRTRECVNC
ncbi:unnamed protein product [Tetraodon nigroviridis]|uniref:(spotted green pufferfish) hypothetical protein n=1 Tax=Tetraodon nigroviridis TaxID=99883 RepID=Q4RK45_TETNG|nr:unnamed protein product [Tetraodon nigroviridis]